jgi:hypothetical protein
MAETQNSLATIDTRSFFEQAINYGVEHGILTKIQLHKIVEDGAKGIVQIANFFGTAYLQASLEVAATRMLNLISLYLADKSNGDLQVAAMSLRDYSLLSHSKGGSDMLKRLNALPVLSLMAKRDADPSEEKSFLNNHTYAEPFSLTRYRKELTARQENQRKIDFARWCATQLKGKSKDYEDIVAEELIRTAMLVWYVGDVPLALPTRVGFAKRLAAMRKAKFKPKLDTFQELLKTAPEDFRRMAEAEMALFQSGCLPTLKDKSIQPEQLIHGDNLWFFTVPNSIEDMEEYSQLVNNEWSRITKGSSNPATHATIFYLVATGQKPKASLLKKDAKAIVAKVRESGFDSSAVIKFIKETAPIEHQSDFVTDWEGDLLPEATIHLSDPHNDDTYMDRALTYLKQSCVASWKG